MQSRVTYRAAAAVTTAALAWSLSACDRGENDPSPDPAASSAPASDTTSTSADSSSTPSSATVTPADGELVENNTMTYRLPVVEGKTPWSTDSLGSTTTSSTLLESGIVDITSSDLKDPDTDLELDAKVSLRLLAGNRPRPRRVANRVINGVECWVIVGKDKTSYSYRIGGLHAGYQFSLLFDVPANWTEADQRIEEVLASIEWR